MPAYSELVVFSDLHEPRKADPLQDSRVQLKRDGTR